MNGVAVPAVTSVSQAELKLERGHFLTVSLSICCTKQQRLQPFITSPSCWGVLSASPITSCNSNQMQGPEKIIKLPFITFVEYITDKYTHYILLAGLRCSFNILLHSNLKLMFLTVCSPLLAAISRMN